MMWTALAKRLFLAITVTVISTVKTVKLGRCVRPRCSQSTRAPLPGDAGVVYQAGGVADVPGDLWSPQEFERRSTGLRRWTPRGQQLLVTAVPAVGSRPHWLTRRAGRSASRITVLTCSSAA